MRQGQKVRFRGIYRTGILPGAKGTKSGRSFYPSITMDPLSFHRHRVFRFQGCRSARRQSAHAMLWTVVKEAAKNRSSHKDSRQGAALAYYSVFSLGPVIVIAIAVAAFFFGGRFCARMACPVR